MGLIVALALVASSCGGDDNDESGATSGSADTPFSDAASEEPTTGQEQLTSEGEGDEAGPGAQLDPDIGGELIYGIASDGTGFNTTDALHAEASRIMTAMNDPLVAVDANGEWTPNVAESLVPNEEFTEWTLTLRPGIQFHDGAPLDAEAVVANLEAFKAGPNVGFALSPVTQIVAVDQLTVRIALATPWASFPFYLAGQPGAMVSPSTIGRNDTFVGVGPFQLDDWITGDSARVVRNDNYWRSDEGFPYLDAITFKVIPEQAGRRQALAAGDIDAYASPAHTDIVDFLEDDDVDVYIGDAAANEALILLNTTAAPVDDVRVRRAMAHAINQQLIVDTFRSGLTTPASSFIDPGSQYSVATDYPGYDPEAARALVDEYEAEVGPIELTLTSTNTAESMENAELVVGLWEEVGIDAEIDPVGPGTEVTPVIGDAFQAIMWVQFASTDPDGDYVFFHSSGGALNWTNLVDPEMDEGFDIGRSAQDPAERAVGYTMVQEAFAEQVPVLWFDHLAGIEAAVASPHVHGIPDGVLPNGEPTIGLVAGSYFSWEDVWLEQ